MRILLAIVLLWASSTILLAIDNEIRLGRFSTGDLSGWAEQTLGLMKTKTTYAFAKNGETMALVAHSVKAASGYIYKLKADPREYPILKWSWKIDHTIKKGDEKTKEGDDFAARIYVLFPRGFFSETRAICYVWANKLPKGEHLPSPFSKNIVTVAVDSGNEFAGRWTFHQRNVYEDYRNFFGEEAPKIGAVAIMTDTDNTGETAVGYYGDISLRVAKPEERSKEQKQHIKEKEPKASEQPKSGNGNTPTPPAPPLPSAAPAMVPQPHVTQPQSRPLQPNPLQQPTAKP